MRILARKKRWNFRFLFTFCQGVFCTTKPLFLLPVFLDCKSVYTGSIPVLASNGFNDLSITTPILVSFWVSGSCSVLVLFICVLPPLDVPA